MMGLLAGHAWSGALLASRTLQVWNRGADRGYSGCVRGPKTGAGEAASGRQEGQKWPPRHKCFLFRGRTIYISRGIQ